VASGIHGQYLGFVRQSASTVRIVGVLVCARTGEYRVDPAAGYVKETHGVSAFDNPASVQAKGFVPHRIDQSSVPSSLQFIQRGNDLSHFEIVPSKGANLTPEAFASACGRILCFN
jgi:hypothetical protein